MGSSDTTYLAGTGATVPDIATLGQVFTPDWVVEAMLEIDERIKCPQQSLEEPDTTTPSPKARSSTC